MIKLSCSHYLAEDIRKGRKVLALHIVAKIPHNPSCNVRHAGKPEESDRNFRLVLEKWIIRSLLQEIC